MKRSISSIALLCAAALLAACAGGDKDATDSAAGTVTDSTPSAATAAGATTDSANAGAAGQGALVDPNTATHAQLMAVPGIDSATANAIVAGRPYENMLGVDRVLVTAKFSEAKRDSVYERMFKPLDLNTATKEEIMLIPGVGERMNREFHEYRPYPNIEKFRREIAKYVADSTIRRYERYVVIK